MNLGYCFYSTDRIGFDILILRFGLLGFMAYQPL